jgi:uncharacterized protein
MALSWPLLAAIAFIFVAAIVRGLTGFGFSLLAITSLSLLYPPAQVIPSILMLEVIASLRLLPEVWRHVHWRSLLPLLAGCLIATPLGVWLLANTSAGPMQVAIGCFTLLAVALLASGFALKSMPSAPASVAIGAASGFANGAAGIGGPPVIIFYFSTPAGAAVGRASLIAYFFATDIIALGFLWPQGLVTVDVAWRALIYSVPLLAGIWLGTRAFKTMDTKAFNRWVLVAMALLGILSVFKGLGLL